MYACVYSWATSANTRRAIPSAPFHLDRHLTLVEYLDPGQAALPGGKADYLSETPFETARREANEEIGLPNIDQSFPSPFWVEHLCELPANLARTELVVRPCVALLHSHNEATGEDADPEEAFMTQLDAKEVAAVFTGPFHNFLKMRDEPRGPEDNELPGEPTDWYDGTWTNWNTTWWRSTSISRALYLLVRGCSTCCLFAKLDNFSAPLLRAHHESEGYEAAKKKHRSR